MESEGVVNTDFSVEERRQGDAAIFTVSGELDLRTSPELEERLNGAFRAGAELVILDLRMIEFMDSTGLRVLLAAPPAPQGDGPAVCARAWRRPGRASADADRVRDLLTVVDAPEELLTAGETCWTGGMTRGSLSRLGYGEVYGRQRGRYLVECGPGWLDGTVRARAS